MDVISNVFYLGEVQKEVLGWCSREGIPAVRKKGLFVYQWSAPGKNKQSGWRWCFCKYYTEVLRFAFDIFGKSELIAKTEHVLNLMEILRPKKRTEGNSMCYFVGHSWKFYSFSSLVLEILHVITFIRRQSHVIKPLVWVFFSGIVKIRRIFGH